MRHFLLCVCLMPLSTLVAQDRSAQAILDRFAAAKPSADKLGFYCLDWAPSLKEAKLRAAQEHRPIVFFWITNITAGCDFYSGHT